MIVLEKAFYGELTEYQDRPVFPKSDNAKSDESGDSFEQSIFYKELKNDISKYWNKKLIKKIINNKNYCVY